MVHLVLDAYCRDTDSATGRWRVGKAAFQKIGGIDYCYYHPSLTQVVVLKRHTAHFFLKNLNPLDWAAASSPNLSAD